MDYRYITGNSDHAHDCAGVNIDDGDTDHIIVIGHGGDSDNSHNIGHDGYTCSMNVTDVSHPDKAQLSVDVSSCPTSTSSPGKVAVEPSRVTLVHRQRQTAMKSYKSLSKQNRLSRVYSHNQKHCLYNLQAAQIIINESNQWMVRLLNVLLNTVKACSMSQRLPSMEFLSQLPVFIDIDGSQVKKPGDRQKWSRIDKMAEENVIKNECVIHNSIQDLLEDLHSHRDSYHQNMIPEISFEKLCSNSCMEKKDMSNSEEQKMICIQLDSQSSIESNPIDNIVIDISDDGEVSEQESVHVENPVVINLGDEEDM